MRASFSTNWIFRGWITNLFIALCVQSVFSKPTCGPKQYLKDDRCCDMCEPGKYVFEYCLGTENTKCHRCGQGEYQPEWTQKRVCERQKYCDPVKGFSSVRPSNPLEATPCQCKPGRQCSPINCEFCERIPSCEAGHGLETDTETARKICRTCERGFFSDNTSMEPCMRWTNCRALGRTERQPGSAHSNAMCGPDTYGLFSSWVFVVVLSLVTVLSLLFLLLCCYKDKLKLLSVNLRSCVQSLKRTRIQQETLGPLFNSGAGGGMEGPGGPNCSLCETTSLIQQAPHGPIQPPQTYPSSPLTVKISLLDAPLPEGKLEESERKGKEKEVEEDEGWGSSEPEEVSGDEGGVGVSPLWAGSCVCVQSVREPLEVGENEDCSQAVSPGALGPCSCGGAEGEREGGLRGQGEGEAGRGNGSGQNGSQEPRASVEMEDAATSPTLSLTSLLRASSPVPLSGPCPKLCLPLAQAKPEAMEPWTHSKVEEGHRLSCSTGSSTTSESPPSLPSKGASAEPSGASLSDGDLYSERSLEASEESGALFSRDSGVDKVSSRDLDPESPPESLRSQLDEPTLPSGQVTGNNNTTFISHGQVMNFSGDVIVVYVGQPSLGNGGLGPDDAFGSPVQEQSTVPLFEGGLDTQTPTPGNPITHNPLQNGNQPTQEVIGEWPREK